MGVTNSALSGLPVPDKAATNDVPYWLSQLVAALDAQLILTATSTSNRDSRYFNAPSGVLCIVRASTEAAVVGVYVKTSGPGTSTWQPVWEAPTPQQPIAIPLADGFQEANGKPPVVLYSPTTNAWTLYGSIGAINGTYISNSTTLGELPAAVSLSTLQDSYNLPAAMAVTGTGSPSGACRINITSGRNIVVYMASGVAASWIGLDGVTLPGA